MNKPVRIAAIVGVVVVGVALAAALWLRSDGGSSATPPAASTTTAAPPTGVAPTTITDAATAPVSTTTAATSTLPPSACVTLRKADETVAGCVFEADTKDLTPTPTRPGAPVYDHAGGVVVGYATAKAGFVPNSLVPQLARVIECDRVAINQGAKAVDATCRALLIEQGYPASYFPGS